MRGNGARQLQKRAGNAQTGGGGGCCRHFGRDGSVEQGRLRRGFGLLPPDDLVGLHAVGEQPPRRRPPALEGGDDDLSHPYDVIAASLLAVPEERCDEGSLMAREETRGRGGGGDRPGSSGG